METMGARILTSSARASEVAKTKMKPTGPRPCFSCQRQHSTWTAARATRRGGAPGQRLDSASSSGANCNDMSSFRHPKSVPSGKIHAN